MKKIIFFIVGLFLLSACSSKRNITYLAGVNEYANTDISKQKTPYTIQVDDVLRIEIHSMVPEAAIVYNRISQNANTSNNLNLLQLEGYLVSSDYSINFPVLGTLDVKGSTLELEKKITKLLLEGGHLVSPTVSVRLLNSKFTVLGEVRQAGTYTFLDRNLTLLQALGYAGDLTIDGERKDITLIREINGIRSARQLDITSKDILDNSAYYIRNNDVIIVNPNYNRIKSAGFIGSPQSIASISSILLSVTLLIINK
ncbi:MAG: polysaccharide biosynthesis/export family protein [Flavobacteriales bacterium]|nr:polysaccharide biosynthesis/export family protein [Flavobacteriales bacterium]